MRHVPGRPAGRERNNRPIIFSCCNDFGIFLLKEETRQMPTYDYECQSCGHRFDEFQNMSDPALTTCPSCNEDALRRLIGGGIGVIFKGSGFYVTDSKSGSPKKSATTSSNGEGSSDKSESSTTDSKKSDGTTSESKATGTAKSESASTGNKSAAAK